MKLPSRHRLLMALGTGFVIACGCNGDAAVMGQFTDQSDPRTGLAPAVIDTLEQLRRASSAFHTLEGAAASGYVTNIGCVDERVEGVDAAHAAGMGYHIGKGADGLALVDNQTDLFEPEFLVYAPDAQDATLPPAERLSHAHLVGFDYFRPGTPDNPPPPLLGQAWTYTNAFGGWMRHIYLWGPSPDGIFANWNPAVALCS